MTSDSMLAEVLRALPQAPAELTPKQIHGRVGQWSYVTIKGALRRLRDSGLVIKGGTEREPVYRRAG